MSVEILPVIGIMERKEQEYLMCDTLWSASEQAIKVKGLASKLEIEEYGDGVRQHLTNEAMLIVPQIMDTNAC